MYNNLIKNRKLKEILLKVNWNKALNLKKKINFGMTWLLFENSEIKKKKFPIIWSVENKKPYATLLTRSTILMTDHVRVMVSDTNHLDNLLEYSTNKV